MIPDLVKSYGLKVLMVLKNRAGVRLRAKAQGTKGVKGVKGVVGLVKASLVLLALRLVATLYLPLCHSYLLYPSALAGARNERSLLSSSQHSANFLSEGV